MFRIVKRNIKFKVDLLLPVSLLGMQEMCSD